MGLVYLAEQKEPLRRHVALKILKRIGETSEVLARFEVERQALAALHHPAIAQVYDAGTAPDGRPFIVMEYVSGQALTDYCDERRLDIRRRLQLFVATCEAVHHANRKGIVHRDLKPANILVTEENGRPTVKVIDFGLAKAIEARLTDRTLYTRAGTLMGTPTYMSPEQADPITCRVDCRSDVYSLGVILYELLVGATPFDPNDLHAGGTLETLRTLREREPPRLAARLKALGQDARRIAACRRTDLTRLLRDIRGDLQCIVQAALEKAPEQRYADVRELGADLDRFLRGEPLQAAQSGLAYRTRKFVVRHRVAAIGSAATVLLALAFGIGASRWLSDETVENPARETVSGPVEVQGLTHTGDAWHGVISPDGRYVVFVQEPQGRLDGRTLWLADRTTWGAERLPVPPTTETPAVMGWSREGRHLYYGVPNEGQKGTYSIYRYAPYVRRAEKISSRASGGVLSPDEEYLADVRNDPGSPSAIVVQRLLGSAERIVATRPVDDPYSGSLAWSPDGETLATSVGHHGTPKRLVGVDIASGRERSLSIDTWQYLGAKVWLSDGRTILISGEKSGDGERNSLYRLDTQSGTSVRTETGLAHISGWQLSASADGRTVAVTHSWLAAKLFLMPDGDSNRAIDLGPASGEAPAFLPHDRLLFTGEDGHAWVVDANGWNRRRVSRDRARNTAASLDGGVLVAAKRQGGFLKLWRMASDGSALVPLPESRPAWLSDVTPDGRWIVYVTGDDGGLWKLATNGKEPVKLLHGRVEALKVAGDGSTVAVLWQDSAGPWQIGVVPLQDGGLAHRQAAPPGTSISAGIHVSQDGSAVDLVRIEGNVGNLWRVPLGRGAPVQLTHFASDRIHSFDWSHDGRRLAVVRGGWRGDIVLLHGDAIGPVGTRPYDNLSSSRVAPVDRAITR